MRAAAYGAGVLFMAAMLLLARQERRATEAWRSLAPASQPGFAVHWPAAEALIRGDVDLELYEAHRGIFVATAPDSARSGMRVRTSAVRHSSVAAPEARSPAKPAASSDHASARTPRLAAGNESARSALVSRPFAVFISGHAGSTWLCSLLDSHPAVVAKGEIFNKVRRAREGLERFWASASHPTGTRAAGFKIRPWAMGQHDKAEWARAWAYLEEANASIICNCRDMVTNAVSRARAGYRYLPDFYDAENGRWRRPAFDLPIDRFMDALKGSIRRTKELFSLCSRAGRAQLPVLWVPYNALYRQRRRTGDDMIRFLGLPPLGLSNSRNVTKYGSANLSDTVPNIHSLLQELSTNQTHLRLGRQLQAMERSPEYKAFCVADCAHHGIDPSTSPHECLSSPA